MSVYLMEKKKEKITALMAESNCGEANFKEAIREVKAGMNEIELKILEDGMATISSAMAAKTSRKAMEVSLAQTIKDVNSIEWTE